MTTPARPVQGPTGKYTYAQTGRRLPLQVLPCGDAGFYLGTADDGGPVARESLETWTLRARAEDALANGAFTQMDECGAEPSAPGFP